MARRARSRDSGPMVITAAAARIDTDGSRDEERREKANEAWQERAWDFYDDLGEVRFAARYMGDSFARCRFVPAIRIGGGDPAPLQPEGDPAQGYSAQDAEMCAAVLSRLKSPQGGQTELLRSFGVQLFVPGDCYLVGRPDEFADGEERWDVYSPQELLMEKAAMDVRKFRLKRGGQGKDIELPPETVVIRVWQTHPRFTDWSDSPIRSALTILDELVILTHEIRGAALSRISGPGLFLLPKSAQTPKPPDAGDDWRDPKVVEMLETWATAIQDPSSAARYTPVFMYVADDIYDSVGQDKLIQWGREADAVMAEQREHLLRRFATAVDLPAEVLTGVATTNHWTAWFVPQEAFSRHIEPKLVIVDDAITTRYFWPALREEGMENVQRFVVWHDASGLITRPDRSTDAMAAYEHLLISGDATRRELGYSDDDMMSPEETAVTVANRSAQRGNTGGSGSPSTVQPGSEEQGPPAGAAILTAAISSNGQGISALDRKLATMDAALLADLQSAADVAMRRTLERANARLRSLALKQSATREIVDGLSPSTYEVIPALGPKVVGRLTAAEDPTQVLLEGAFDGLGSTWNGRTGRSIEELLSLGQKYGTLSDVEVAILRGQLEDDSHAGWLLLLGSLVALASTLLYQPTGTPDLGPAGEGEADETLVAVGLIRAALARAGGGGMLAAKVPASSFLTGETIAKLWRAAGISFEGWRWDYGDGSRRREFIPHSNLDGVEFTSWDDDRLGNKDGRWPYVSHWSPADHRGCMCLAERTGAKAGTVPDEPLVLAGRQA